MAGRARQRAAALATKDGIAKAAASEFISSGYAGVSLSRIADHLGVTKGALVYHFRAKADFATYFVHVAREATAQADAFARSEYPECGSRRLLLYFLTLAAWSKQESQIAAGIALFADTTSPTFEADEVIQDWLSLSLDALKTCEAHGVLNGGMDASEAAEFFLVTNLGARFFGRHIQLQERGASQIRFVRLALTAVGVPDVDEHAAEVVEKYATRLPEFHKPT